MYKNNRHKRGGCSAALEWGSWVWQCGSLMATMAVNEVIATSTDKRENKTILKNVAAS